MIKVSKEPKYDNESYDAEGEEHDADEININDRVAIIPHEYVKNYYVSQENIDKFIDGTLTHVDIISHGYIENTMYTVKVEDTNRVIQFKSGDYFFRVEHKVASVKKSRSTGLIEGM
jgi:hypothetical protein